MNRFYNLRFDESSNVCTFVTPMSFHNQVFMSIDIHCFFKSSGKYL